MGLAGGEGKVGEKGEGFTPHLMVVLARREVDGGGGSAERGGRRWLCSPASMLRRAPAVFDRVYSTSERRGRFWWRPNKQWGSGMAWPRRARACRRQWRAADGEMGSGRTRGLGARFIGGKEREGELGASLLGKGRPGEARTAVAARPAVAVASAQMAGARGEPKWCQEGAVLGRPGAHEVVWAWGSAPVRPGGRRRRTASPVDEVQRERRWKKLAVAVL